MLIMGRLGVVIWIAGWLCITAIMVVSLLMALLALNPFVLLLGLLICVPFYLTGRAALFIFSGA